MTERPIRFGPTLLEAPLSGVRAYSSCPPGVAGNIFLSAALADFGADVVKIEPPQGDPLRDWTD